MTQQQLTLGTYQTLGRMPEDLTTATELTPRWIAELDDGATVRRSDPHSTEQAAIDAVTQEA